MAAEARGENERALFGQRAINGRYREFDAREARLDQRDERLAIRETTAERRDEDQAGERLQMAHDDCADLKAQVRSRAETQA